MQFLVVTRRRTEAFAAEAFTPELLEAEQQRVRELYAAGQLRQIWRRGDMPGACLMFEAETVQDVRDAIGTLPLAQRGMLEVMTLTPLQPYPGMGPR
jgi:muconolactone delta-isomerase